MISNIINHGLQGMQRSQRAMAESAHYIATEPVNYPAAESNALGTPRRPELTESLVEINYQSQLFQANAKVIEAGEETLGTLIDELA